MKDVSQGTLNCGLWTLNGSVGSHYLGGTVVRKGPERQVKATF